MSYFERARIFSAKIVEFGWVMEGKVKKVDRFELSTFDFICDPWFFRDQGRVVVNMTEQTLSNKHFMYGVPLHELRQ